MPFTDAPTWKLSQAQQRAHSILTTKLAEADARAYDYRVLDVLAESATPLSQIAIGSLARLDRRDVTVTLAALEEDGYVERKPDSEDARRNVVTLTDVGRERAGLLTALAADAQEDFLAPLDAEARAAFIGALRLLMPSGAPPTPVR